MTKIDKIRSNLITFHILRSKRRQVKLVTLAFFALVEAVFGFLENLTLHDKKINDTISYFVLRQGMTANWYRHTS